MASAHTKQPGRQSLSPLPRWTHCSDSAAVGSSASLLCRKTLSHGLSVSRLSPDTHLGFPSFHPHRCKDSDLGELIRKTKCSDATTIYGLFAFKMEYGRISIENGFFLSKKGKFLETLRGDFSGNKAFSWNLTSSKNAGQQQERSSRCIPWDRVRVVTICAGSLEAPPSDSVASGCCTTNPFQEQIMPWKIMHRL